MTCAGWVYTAGTTTATTVYIWGEGKKFYVLTKRVKKKYISVWFGDFPITYQIKGGKWVGYL